MYTEWIEQVNRTLAELFVRQEQIRRSSAAIRARQDALLARQEELRRTVEALAARVDALEQAEARRRRARRQRRESGGA